MAGQKSDRPQLHGASYSVYVRIARLALLEKSVTHDHREVEIFAAGGPPAAYLELHPFARIPALVHGDFTLYETGAITRYVDEAFDGPSLQPTSPESRARMNQIISIADNYLYRPLVWGVYVARDDAAKNNTPLDQPTFDDAVAKSRHCLAVVAGLCGDRPWLSGDSLSLADLYLAPMIAYGCVAAEGRALLQEQPYLATWWNRMKARPSMTATRFAEEN